MSLEVVEVAAGDARFAALGADETPGADARLRVALRGGVPVARVAVTAAEGLVGAPGRSGMLGHYAAEDDDAGVALLRGSASALADAGCVRVLGPMNGGTWGRYRLIVDAGAPGDPPFLSEPVHPPAYVDHFHGAGFREVAHYESAIVEALDAGDPRAAEFAARATARGITVRPLDAARFDEELRAIHRLSLAAFAVNPFYAPIGFEAFRARYAPLRPLLDPGLILIADGPDGVPVGLVFAFPDPLSARDGRPTRVVLKTLATAPEARGLGLGTLLTDEVRRIARERGFRAVIHALMHAGNASVAISRHSARVFRRYALFGWTP
jgi:ribosomal protein S18 acetylase RimI-like enzyme